MTREEKARAYDEAKERMRAFLKEWEDCRANGEAMEKARSVFPELAESEDERIRTELLSSFKGIMADADEDELWYGLPYNDIIAYLEKQKEQKPAIKLVFPKFRVGDIIRNARDKWDKTTRRISYVGEHGYNFDYRHLGDKVSGGSFGFCFEDDYELVEQKPTEWSDYKDKVNVPYCSSEPEWSEEDEHRRKDAVYFLESAMKHYADTSEIEKAIAWLKSLSLNLKKRNEDAAKLCSNEWSEEDERIRKAILGFVNPDKGGTKYSSNAELVEWSDWLKSLRPQPKQEWSEEDETMWSNLIWYLEGKVGMLPSGKERYIKWLKERFVKLVYPKSGWKPSEEQMKALQNAVALTACDKELARLYNQLKKL